MTFYLFLSFIPFLVILTIMILNFIVKLSNSVTEIKLKQLEMEKTLSFLKLKENDFNDAIEVIKFYSTLKIDRGHELRIDGKQRKVGSLAQEFLNKISY